MTATTIHPPSPPEHPSAVRFTTETILVVDEVGSTERLVELGPEEAFREQLRLDRLIESTVGTHHGCVDHWCGDGAIARFGCAAAATSAAVRLLATAAEVSSPHAHAPVRLRAAAHLGRLLIDDERRSFGLGLVVAVRICDRTEADTVVVSDPVADVLGGHGWGVDPLGPAELKGVPEPLDLWRVASVAVHPCRCEPRADRRDEAIPASGGRSSRGCRHVNVN